MPKADNLVAYEDLSDVVLEVRYTALDGGARFRSQMRERQWAPLVQPALQYPADWSRFMTEQVENNRQTLRFDALRLVPPPTSGRSAASGSTCSSTCRPAPP
jgi:hypothetical protein